MDTAIWAVLTAAALFGAITGQQQQRKSLDPNELQSLKLFAKNLGISDLWDFSVDPCWGSWNSTASASNFLPTRGIECDCSLEFCHVTKIAVVSMNAGGRIGPEIGNFSYLNDLNLGQNVLTGQLPEQIGSLSRLQFFNVAINKLTGPFPRSIGKLTQLFSMGFGSNYFTGTLPSEIGNLNFLMKLYMDACGLGGELPSTFGNLSRLETLWMAYNDFNGSIPDFMGNMTNLQDVKMFGNKFQGQIPWSLGNLKALKILNIGDVSAGGVIPPTLNGLTSLNKLSLRNCHLTGSIPDLSNLKSLTFLDLSFNNLTGQVPASFGNFSLINTLLLANNRLSGGLPTELGSLRKLQRLDVSFNDFSGPLPSWLKNNASMQRNMIWNQFDVIPSESSLVNCLQSRSNCNMIRRNYQLAINCGGPRLVTSLNKIFSDDSAAVGVGTYYTNTSEGWAVSATGYNDEFQALSATNRPVLETRDPSLYQTGRSAPSSVKYFGLGMVNGAYNLNLHFAEIAIDNSSGWTAIARRIFDVYVQGSQVLKDFNIQEEASGSLKAIVKNFPLQVSDGMLMVELLWKGRGTCCYGPLISAIEVIPEFDTSELSSSPSSKSQKVVLAVGLPIAVAFVICIVFCVLCIVRSRRRRLRTEQQDIQEDMKSLEGKPNSFTYNEMKAATKGFSPENKLGQGGFGAVYKGVLTDGKVVAIKQLSSKSTQGDREFINEVTTISAVQHRNLVRLHGCCVEGANRILVYEYLENNSLARALFETSKTHLDWPTRFNICLGVARGMAYLHEESLPRIIHRDIKASNVLLDKTLSPKIADFGLAKLFEEDHLSHVSTRVAGTVGYLAPEYAMRGQLTEKADVYSFGVLALEVVSGRGNLDMSLPDEMVYLLEWAWHLYESNRPLELLDKEVDNFVPEEVLRVIQVALLCSQAVARSRPKMSLVVAMLSGTASVDTSSLRPGYFSALKDAAPGLFYNAKSGPPPPVLEARSPVTEEEEDSSDVFSSGAISAR